MKTTFKLTDTGEDERTEMDLRTYNLARMQDHYERMGYNMVSSNIQMALVTSGVNKEQRALGAIAATSLAIARVYMEYKDMLMLRTRLNTMRKYAKGSAAYGRATAAAGAMEAGTLGLATPVIAASIAAAMALIALIYSIPRLEKGGVMTDRDIIPLERANLKRTVIRNKIYYLTDDMIPSIVAHNAQGILAGGI